MRPARKYARLSLLVIVLLGSYLPRGLPHALADELRADTNAIESLTPEQATRLVAGFPGAEFEVEIKGFGRVTASRCLPLNGLKSVDAETAKALAGYGKGPLLLDGLTTLSDEVGGSLSRHKNWLFLNGLTTLSGEAAKVLAKVEKWDGQLPSLTSLDSPDAVEVAKALAARKGPLLLPNLKKLSPQTLLALIAKQDVVIPLIETLELIPEPDGSATDDFLIPEDFLQRQRQPRPVRAVD